MKRFPQGSLSKVLRAFLQTNGRIDPRVASLLAATVYTGLRPVEWMTAYLSEMDDAPVLIVQNAKTKPGLPPTRTLVLTDLASHDIEIIQRTLQFMQSYSDWKGLYNAIKQRVHDVVRRTLPPTNRYPTLYSARHQFVADLKAAGRAIREISALVGHTSVRTTIAEYGKRRTGTARRGSHVRALAAEAMAVRDDIVNPRDTRPTAEARLSELVSLVADTLDGPSQ